MSSERNGLNIDAASPTHPQDPVSRDDGRLIIDSCNLDVHCARQALLPQDSVVGRDREAVVQGLAAVVDIVDELVLNLWIGNTKGHLVMITLKGDILYHQ